MRPIPHLALAMTVATVVAPQIAAAAPQLEPGAPTVAQQRYVMARELYRKGDLEGAAREFESALEVFPTSAKLAYNLARTLERLDRAERAIVFYERYLKNAPEADDRGDVEAVLAALRRRVAAARGEAVVTSTPVGASVFLDDQEQALGVTPMTVQASPGPHVLRLELAGHATALRPIDLEKGQRVAVAVALDAANWAPSLVGSDSPQVRDADPAEGGWRSTAGWVTVGLGAAALGVGGYFTTQAADSADKTGGLYPVDAALRERYIDDMERQQTLAGVGYGLGVALLGAGVALLVWPDDEGGTALRWGGTSGQVGVRW